MCQSSFDHPLMENMFSCIDKYELPLIFHIAPHQYGYYGILDDENLTGLEGALQKFPNIKFLGHSADFGARFPETKCGGYPDGPVVPAAGWWS